jgi:iron complex outermembrane receptor protein
MKLQGFVIDDWKRSPAQDKTHGNILSLILLVIAMILAPPIRSQSQQNTDGLADKSLEELMNIKVTSASKKPENRSDAPAAIFVITGEDIIHGGFSSIPDALRMVPGLYVAQEDSHSWIVAARGFSGAFNDKMLVLLDGRLLYQPLFGGVYWDTVDPPLKDIDRIEIIRGPGGTLWGANAVNGVINIITKTAQNTEGTTVSASAGINEGYVASIRYGDEIGQNFAYRVYGQSRYGDPTADSSGSSQLNPWNLSQGGMRMDWDVSHKDNLSIEGQGYSGRVDTSELIFSGPAAASAIQLEESNLLKGGDILGRWKHEFSDRSNTDLLAYCDWVDRVDILGGDVRNTCDLEVQHDLTISPRHSIIWGGNVLTTADTPSHTFEISYVPAMSRNTTIAAFGQYEVSVVPNKLRIIGGAKIEHNPYTGFQIQPQLRGVWTPDKANTLWGAVSRAVSDPTELGSDTDLKVSETAGGPLPVFAAITGNQALDSEVIRAYELGYRYRLNEIFSFDLSAFYNDYGGLINPGPPGTPVVFPTYIEVPLPEINSGNGETHGLELFAEVKPASRWSLSAAVTELRGAATPGFQGIDTPHHMLNVQSRFNLSRHFEFNSSYYYDDAILDLGVPVVNRADIGFSARKIAGFTFSIWGRNLQSARHLENTSSEPYFPAGEIRRAIVFKMMWQSE